MDLKGTLVRYIFLSAIVFSSFPESSHGKDITRAELFKRSLGDLPAATTRALKSVRKLTKGFSGGSKEDLFSSRRLLQGTQDCAFVDGECSVTQAKALQLLSSELSQFVLEIVKCAEAESEAECSAPNCVWLDGDCDTSEEFLGPAAFEECIGDAAVFIETDDRNDACQSSHSAENACNADEDCTWDADAGECAFDIFKYLIGVPSAGGLPLGFEEVIDVYVEFLGATATDDGLFTSTDLDAILAWTPPPFQCPGDTNSLSCELVVFFQEVFVDSVYCQTKFPTGDFSAEDCNNDPLCGVNEDSECFTSEEETSRVQRKVLTSFAASVESQVFRDILEPSFQCAFLEEAECEDSCVWDASEGECGLNLLEVSDILGKTAIGNPKAECQVLGAVFKTGCPLSTASQCDSNPVCEIDGDGDCGPAEDILVDIVLNANDSTRDRFAKAVTECGAKSEANCQ
ncbi:hypothetical protein BSKO_12837 [Bryopsis sp. KO-2023]|nr:hypothetical protein BSKO_12837 [Bryopsis sp. KO-2023]